jgi:hypothetical protein
MTISDFQRTCCVDHSRTAYFRKIPQIKSFDEEYTQSTKIEYHKAKGEKIEPE